MSDRADIFFDELLMLIRRGQEAKYGGEYEKYTRFHEDIGIRPALTLEDFIKKRGGNMPSGFDELQIKLLARAIYRIANYNDAME